MPEQGLASSLQLSPHKPEPNDGFCPFVFTCDEDCMIQSYLYDYGVAGSLGLLSIIFSLYFICQHRSYYTNPHFQSKIIDVNMLSNSFYCCNQTLAPYFTLIRDVYEAFLLFTFFYLIFSYLAYDEETNCIVDERVYIRMIEAEKQVTHMFPFNLCTKPYLLTSQAKAKYFTYRCKKYVLQFFVFKPVLSAVLVVMELFIEPDSDILLSIGSFIRFFIGCSVTYSLYYLIMFYQALKKPLAPWHPLLKFLTIKITLFFTFWQSMTLEYVVKIPLLNCFDKRSPFFNEERILYGIENTLICFEMCLMAIAGGIAYSYKPFIIGIIKEGGFSEVFKDNWETFKKDFRLIKPKKFGFTGKHKQLELVPTFRPSVENKSVDIEFENPKKNLYEALNPSYV